MAKGRVVIAENLCKGCTLCASVCPQDVLVMVDDRINVRGYHPVKFIDPLGKCTGCGLCAVICPDAVFTVYRQRRSPSRHQGASALL